MGEVDVHVSIFDFKSILQGDSILVIHNDRDRAMVLVNRILKEFRFEYGTLLTTAVEHDKQKFKYKKQVHFFDSKTLVAVLKEVYGRQSFGFNTMGHIGYIPSGNPGNPGQGFEEKKHVSSMHFLPKSLILKSPFLQGLDEKSYLQINKYLMIPPSFLVFHYCFPKNFPTTRDQLMKMVELTHHRLLLICTVHGNTKYNKSAAKPKWVFCFPKEFPPDGEELAQWFKVVFSRYFYNFETFRSFLDFLSPTQGIVVNTKVSCDLPSEMKPVIHEGIFVVKQLRKKGKKE